MKYTILHIVLSILLMMAPLNYMTNENDYSEVIAYAMCFGISLLSLLIVQILRLLNEIIDRMK